MSTELRGIENILTHSYDHSAYLKLAKEIFDGFHENRSCSFQKEYSNFNSHIEGFLHLGNYTDPEGHKLAVFAVQLKKKSYVENSRSTQRSFAKKLIENGGCDAALVAFYTPDESKWRLSFVRLDYEMKIENGRLKATENLTPAKRYSYLVGEDEPCYTAIDRFRYFIENENTQPTLDELEAAFSVEKVTDEFFKLYCEKYQQLKDYLENNEEFQEEAEEYGFSAEQFAKKLMGQIVFLYFLQKKGWLGVRVFPKILTEKAYKDVFYTGGVHGRIIKEWLPKLYVGPINGEYRFKGSVIREIPGDEQEVIAKHMVGKNAWGEGSHRFMRKIFDYSRKYSDNFYEDYLEPLFYDTLNQNRGDLSYCPLFFCRVPFLSGGLFEPINGYDWRNSKFNIPDTIFSNRQSENDRNANGILDVFDRFNFTISEDEPLEKEVAIDPEMLGKVFESMLDVSDRKSKGAFYTPREIVHYMCQESLINYLVTKTGISEPAIRDFILYGDFIRDEDTVKSRREGQDEMFISPEIFEIKNGECVTNRLRDIDDALISVKVADPAVGSGAFPMGMVNEIVRARQNLTAYMTIGMKANDKRLLYANDRSPYRLKREAIKNSIFACDIEPSAVDIARLRLWLSLVIDDEINPEAQTELDGHTNPIPLPNLECNIICGNSLIDEIEGQKLIHKSSILNTAGDAMQIGMTQQIFESLLQKYLKAQDQLFECKDTHEKEELEKRLQQLKDQIIEQDIQLEYCNERIKKAYLDSKAMPSKPYVLWELEFARVFRDNGGFDIVIGNPPYVQLQKTIDEETGLKLGDLYKNLNFKTFTRTGDIYCLFYEQGYNLLRKNGILSYITSNKWMRAGYGKELRNFLTKNTNPVQVIDFAGQKIFESATVDVNILIFEKAENKKQTISCIANEACRNNLSVFVNQNHSVSKFDGEDSWVILSAIEQRIKEKIEAVGTPLKDWDISINRGILTGLNEAFIISGEKKDELIAADPKSAEIIRPILRGRDIKRYGNTFADLWLINVHNGVRNSNIPRIDVNKYPAIKAHLDHYYDKLKKRQDKGDTPYNLRNCAYMDDFSKPKIIFQEMVQSPCFCLDTNTHFMCLDTGRIIIGEKLEYLVALLNSKLFFFAIKFYYGGGGLGSSGVRMKHTFFELFSAYNPSQSELDYFNSFCLKEATDTDLQKVDQFFYEKYNLSDDEIKYIENHLAL